jgi:hypothetical protein
MYPKEGETGKEKRKKGRMYLIRMRAARGS